MADATSGGQDRVDLGTRSGAVPAIVLLPRAPERQMVDVQEALSGKLQFRLIVRGSGGQPAP